MSVRAVLLVLTLFGFAGFAAFAVWAVVQGSRMSGGWSSLGPIWPYVAGGVAAMASLAAFLMWLAFYSSRKGYDERVDHDLW